MKNKRKLISRPFIRSRITVMLVCLLACFSASAEMDFTDVIQTTSGQVQGLVIDDIHTFKGIRYGAPPTGKRRFLPPEKPAPAIGRIDATHYGAPAIQLAEASAAEPVSDFSMRLRTVFPTPSELKIDNEDCLFLNVWTPGTGDNKKRPVMVWFHGGGFNYGSGAWPPYNGENLARRGDVVVVTVNHRLNIFGYLYLAEILGPDYVSSGNAGMLDLVLSLEWVKDNIMAFGGDPENVTIMGESGGGFKVSLLMAMPAAKGLFHKAVIQSGPGLAATPAIAAAKKTQTVLNNLGAIDTESAMVILQTATAEELLAAAAGKNGAMRFDPVIDNTVLYRAPFVPDGPEISADIPLLIGFNKDEMTIFQASQPWFGKLSEKALATTAAGMPQGTALLKAFKKIHPDYSPTHLMAALASTWATHNSYVLADAKANQNKGPVFMYELAWETPISNGMLRCPHTLEIPLMFDNVEKSRALVGPGPEPQKMADQMSSAWIAFAKTGNPNTDRLPDWPAYTVKDRSTMVFNLKSEVKNDPYKTVRAILAE